MEGGVTAEARKPEEGEVLEPENIGGISRGEKG